MAETESTFLLLSVDGGGIRGIVPALLLLDLHHEGHLDFGSVSLFAGTSTGSLIAVGLAGGLDIEHIASVYRNPESCRQIFTLYEGGGGKHGKRGCFGLLLSVVERLLRGRTSGMLGVLHDLLFPKYASWGVGDLIRREAPDKTIGELRQGIFVPTVCLDTEHDGRPEWRPTAFHNLQTPKAERDGFGGYPNASLADAILASAAAPTDFLPHELDRKRFVDGGVVALNPSALALSAAIGAGLVGEGGVPLDRVYVLSLGTGSSYTHYPPHGVAFPPPYGALGWMWPVRRGHPPETPAVPILSAVQDSGRVAADYHVRMMLPEDNYKRVELSLANQDIPLDDCAGLPALEQLTRTYIRSEDWSEVRRWVGRHFR